MSSRWFRNAIIYSLDVDTFKDSNGDGIGDFQGLTDNLDYLESLGVTCLWLLPFYPSPQRDNGYDVTDYYGIDPRLGTPGDFVHFMREADERGLRVIIDLVLNHTSIDHPWFQAARAGSREYRDYYVWREDEPPDTSHEAIFPPEQKGIWTWDEKVGAWYMHRFYESQPDLNITNPAVREEMKRIMGYWLRLGVSGFRVDAAPYLIELHKAQTGGDGGEEGEYCYDYLNAFRDFLSWNRGDAVMLAEANVTPDLIQEYFGQGDRMHLLFNFMANQHTFLSLARGSAAPLRGDIERLPPQAPGTDWAYFLRNHDELSLDKLTEAEREECFRAFAPEEGMRIFNRGIRRRLAPMLEGDQDRVLLAFSLLFSMPGVPVLWYGEELGMGDDQALPERYPVRTPMQWTPEENAGFSSAPPEKMIRPVVRGGVFDYREVNVEVQQRAPHSTLQMVTRMIQARKKCPEFGMGEWRALETDGGDGILAHTCTWEGREVAAVHNLTAETCRLNLNTGGQHGQAYVDLLGGQENHTLGEGGGCALELEPYGFRWLRRRGPAQ